MRPNRSALALAALALLAVPTLAAAAAPTKGATYQGQRPDSQRKEIILRVNGSGTAATARLNCSDTRVAVFTVKISGGRFAGTKGTGDDVSVSLRGRFTSATTAKARLGVPAACDGNGGPITLTAR